MIRPFTCVCLLLAGGSGLYLYQSKHRVQMIDHEIEAIMREAETARARTGVLKAEWTLMNDPERLGALAGKFLALKTTTPGQFTTMADLDARLPPVRPPDQPATGSTDEDAPADPAKPAEVATGPHPATPPAAPVPAAAPAPAAAPVAPAAVAQAKPAPAKPRPVQVAAQSAPLPAAPGQTVSLLGRPVSYAPPAPAPSAYAPPPYIPPAAPRVAAASAPAAAAVAPPIVGSSLGMAWRPHD
jgi:hypothetical protein